MILSQYSFIIAYCGKYCNCGREDFTQQKRLLRRTEQPCIFLLLSVNNVLLDLCEELGSVIGVSLKNDGLGKIEAENTHD